MHTTCLKDFMVVMESFEGDIKGIEGIFSENILACNVAEIEECFECLGDIHRDIAFECVQKDLT